MMKLNNRKHEGGFSLLELLLVVGVGAILLLAGIVTYRLVTQGNEVTESKRLVATVKERVQRAFQNQNTYGANADITATMIRAGVFPSRYLNGPKETATGVINPYGGAMLVYARNNAFWIDMRGVSQQACIQLGRLYTERDSDFRQYYVDGTWMANPTVEQLTQNCDSDPVTRIIWEFR